MKLKLKLTVHLIARDLPVLLCCATVWGLSAQSTTSYVREHNNNTLIDAPPIDGEADTGFGGSIHMYVGQVPMMNERQPAGLARAIVRFPLPGMPDDHYLQSATLGIFLQGIHADSLSPNLGPVSVFHNVAVNEYNRYSLEILADSGYDPVAEIVNIESAFLQYHYADVTQAVRLDYLKDPPYSTISAFGLKVDGLQWQETGSGYFHLAGQGDFGPELRLRFEPIPEPAHLIVFGTVVMLGSRMFQAMRRRGMRE